MRDHSECAEVIDALMAAGKFGEADYAQARCTRSHVNLDALTDLPTDERTTR